MKYVNGNEIEQLITMKEVIDLIEDYYKNDKDKNALVPERLFINDGENTAILMPSFFEDYYAAKVIGIAPGNAMNNEPTLRGTIVLYERQTMKPILLLDARTITAIRTGAISGIGMKYMARDSASTVGVIGTGDQGWTHLLAACTVRPVTTAYIYNRSSRRLEAFIKKARSKFPNIQFIVGTQEEILQKSEIIITTTTSKDPVLPEMKGIDLSGKHFACSGAFKYDMQEIPDYIIEAADNISVDTYAAFSECGEMKKAKSIGYNQDNVFDTKRLVLYGENQSIKESVTIFKSVGVAILDVLTSKLVYEKLRKN